MRIALYGNGSSGNYIIMGVRRIMDVRQLLEVHIH